MPFELKQVGYTHRIVADVSGPEVYFDPDEDRNSRDVEQEGSGKRPEAALLEAIAAALESFVKKARGKLLSRMSGKL